MEDNLRMEVLDILFAKRFIDAYELCSHGTQPTKNWQIAFEARISKSI
jgi:hypothetical protein